jgi:hypothetical protein
LVEALLRLPRNEQPSEIDELLETAVTVYEEDPWIFETVVELQAGRIKDDADALRSLRFSQILKWREFASSARGLIRLTHLEHALELARVHGLSGMANELRREIQAIPADEFDFNKTTASFELPNEKIEEYIEWFAGGGDWRECLTRFGAYGPPSGDHSANLAAVVELMQAHPLLFLFRKTVMDQNNFPIRIAASEEEHKIVELSEYEARSMSIWALFAVDILARIKDRYGMPKAKDLTDFFSTDIISKDIAERFGRALRLFWMRQPDESAHILLPRIETVIREISRQVGLAIIREPVGTSPGGVRTLGELIRAMEGYMDESWRRYFWNLLADPVGLNFRNRLLHGLIPKAGQTETVLLIHAACNLRLMQVGKIEVQPADEQFQRS